MASFNKYLLFIKSPSPRAISLFLESYKIDFALILPSFLSITLPFEIIIPLETGLVKYILKLYLLY